MTTILTKDLLSSLGVLNKEQCSLLDVSWPPAKGWTKRLIGMKFPDQTINDIRVIALLKKQNKRERALEKRSAKSKKYQALVSKYSRPDIKEESKKHQYRHPELGKADYGKFYKSNAWRQLRYLALRNSDGRCQCCGAKASDGVVMHVDHIFPRSKFPHLELSLDNVQVLCSDCNLGKGDWDTTNWRKHWESI